MSEDKPLLMFPSESRKIRSKKEEKQMIQGALIMVGLAIFISLLILVGLLN